MDGNEFETTTAPSPENICKYHMNACDVASKNDADTAWVLICTILVFGMIPGLALYESGLLRLKNSVSIITQTLGGMCILSMLWILFGYSLVFGRDINGWVGDFHHAVFMDMDGCHPNSNVTRSVVAIFQMMFACITPLLITGTVAERMRWKPFLVLIVLWEILVYYFLAHWMWNVNGWLAKMGALDFAGGIVIHTSAGASAVVIAAKLGRRHDYDRYEGHYPHSDLRFVVIGATLLWTGWFGFNAGSALGANSVAIQAVINTQISAAFSAGVWLISAWFNGKPSARDIIDGAIAGMAGITPASGYVNSQSAIVISIILGIASFQSMKLLKYARIDDALGVSCVHGFTGLLGALSTGFAGSNTINCNVPYHNQGLMYTSSAKLIKAQAVAVVVAIVYPALMTYGILTMIEFWGMRLRARFGHEVDGLDISHHNLDAIHDEERESFSQTSAQRRRSRIDLGSIQELDGDESLKPLTETT
eukprot:m.334752 g.334752  ORF g.334752 m.334752 type:complete len:478 (+) comp17426_c0_seq1:216-1649(+)